MMILAAVCDIFFVLCIKSLCNILTSVSFLVMSLSLTFCHMEGRQAEDGMSFFSWRETFVKKIFLKIGR